MAAIEERVDTLEMLIGQFIVQTNLMYSRMEKDTRALKEEMREFKYEMSLFKEEMQDFKNEMSAFKLEMLDFKKEMQDFKKEMQDFKEESRRERKEMNKRWGDIANSLGRLVEDIAAPNIPFLAQHVFHCGESTEFFGIRVKKPNKNAISTLREFDVVAVYEKHLIINETKTNPRIDYIDNFIETLKIWQNYFPEYAHKTLIPIFCSLYISDDVVNYLSKNCIYAMSMGEENMTILNPNF
ncbi:MAG: hypothetical protein RIT27_737 [Pseudomonadota bacterium]|jgi:hypothetical protein